MWVQKITGAGVDGVAFARDGRELYVLDGLGRFVAWEVGTHASRPIGRLGTQHRFGMDRLLVSPDGWFVVALQAGTSVALWATADRGYRAAEVPWPSLTAFVPDH